MVSSEQQKKKEGAGKIQRSENYRKILSECVARTDNEFTKVSPCV